MEKVKERLKKLSMPEPNTGCWIWMGTINNMGYGAITINGKPIKAHRSSYMVHVGAIPSGLHVLHRCDNTLCINPDHLFLGTHQDNMDDMGKKGRRTKGENHKKSKLTNETVLAIREAKGSLRDIAKQFGISFGCVSKIKLKTRWKHL